MKAEKSCGTVLFTISNGEVYYILIKSADNGHCGFPKGHMEAGETEEETALRETWEETSVNAEIIGNFRKEEAYILPNGTPKTVVYFLAMYAAQTPKNNEGFEKHDILVCHFEEAYNMLTHGVAKEILKEADKYIRNFIL